MTKKEQTGFDKIKPIVGVVLFLITLGIHAFVKDLPGYVIVAPFLLLGFSVAEVINIGGNKK